MSLADFKTALPILTQQCGSLLKVHFPLFAPTLKLPPWQDVKPISKKKLIFGSYKSCKKTPTWHNASWLRSCAWSLAVWTVASTPLSKRALWRCKTLAYQRTSSDTSICWPPRESRKRSLWPESSSSASRLSTSRSSLRSRAWKRRLIFPKWPQVLRLSGHEVNVYAEPDIGV